MLAMAPLLPGGLLGGFEDIVGGVGGSGEETSVIALYSGQLSSTPHACHDATFVSMQQHNAEYQTVLDLFSRSLVYNC